MSKLPSYIASIEERVDEGRDEKEDKLGVGDKYVHHLAAGTVPVEVTGDKKSSKLVLPVIEGAGEQIDEASKLDDVTNDLPLPKAKESHGQGINANLDLSTSL